ncbi:YbgA family protein [Solidesulfovibrio sp. C21]|uniref:YbgA family protein n=1 Tax=Solidesulfovibrio sp. C21 TaxID=3398613 RepID=UPI0039FC7A9D
MPETIRVGVSTCLLGEPVRYDGGHKRDAYVVETLGRFFEFVPVCPEVECGLPVPREPMRLVGDPAAPRLVTIKTGLDLTDKMRAFAARRVEELARENLCGYIFKSKSPSSGYARVKVYNDQGVPVPKGVGLFARAFMDRFPLIPAEDEGRLHDEKLRENFIERIFTLSRWRKAVAGDGTTSLPARLVAFTARHKLLLMAHSPEMTRQLGRLTAEAKSWPADALPVSYETVLMRALALAATPAKHANVLEHIAGYFKKLLSADEKAELHELITQYRTGLLPLIVPVTLLAHYTRKYDVAYLKDQYYLHPHPVELKLRNHA